MDRITDEGAMNPPNPCRHHWLIAELADLPRGQARCKLCGVSKPMPDPFIDVPYQELQKRTFAKGKEERPAFLWTARLEREV